MILLLKGKPSLKGLVIGVGRGSDITILHEYLDIKMLYLIDAYKPFRLRNIVNSDYVEQYEDAKPLIEEHKDTVCFINKWTYDAVDDIPNLLDFVWIDFTDDYNTFMETCNLYFPKVKIGGIFAGNRYTYHFPTLKKALKDFIRCSNLKLNKITSKRNKHNGEWWIIK